MADLDPQILLVVTNEPDCPTAAAALVLHRCQSLAIVQLQLALPSTSLLLLLGLTHRILKVYNKSPQAGGRTTSNTAMGHGHT